MLTLTDVSKTFGSGEHKVHAVRKVRMEVPTACFAAVIGRSGSGKSTLLSLMGALDRPTSGTISVDGEEITSDSDRKLIQYRRTMIGFVFQSFNLVPNLSALENVALPMEFAGVGRSDRTERARQLLSSVGLEGDKQARRPSRLSGGEQQRVAIARAIANRPKLILADEPTGNLDTATGRGIVRLLKDLAVAQNTTIVTVTHDRALAKQADVVFEMSDGKLRPNGSKSSPVNEVDEDQDQDQDQDEDEDGIGA